MSAEPALAWYQNCVSVPDRVGATAKPCGLISGVGSVEMNGADLIIVGGGSAGAALAGLIARDQSVSVLLLEAGPDYGHQRAGRWPSDLLDAWEIPQSHQWGYRGRNHATHTELSTYDRARVIGGCSAHNGCVELYGHRRDYDAWAELGNPGWDWLSIEPAIKRAIEMLRVRIPDTAELTPFQAAFLEGAQSAGVPRVADLNDPDDAQGVAPSPTNIVEGTRWNSAFAYLDPVRDQSNLTVLGHTTVRRLLIHSGRVSGVHASVDGTGQDIHAERVILAAGAYGSPIILLHSGIGDPMELESASVACHHPLPGVGKHLTDHPIIDLKLKPSQILIEEMNDFVASGWLPDEQVLLKARSTGCTEAFDLHLFAVSRRDPKTGEWSLVLPVSCMDPHSRGALRLSASGHADDDVVIDHGFLSDSSGHDRAVLADGVELGRQIARSMIRQGLINDISSPPDDCTGQALLDHIDRGVSIYYHPSSTCRMGPEQDALAVVDEVGAVRGLDGLFVCDASIFPTIMRSNTNLPTVALAEHMAPMLGNWKKD